MDSLTKYRLDSALDKMESAKLLLDAGKYKDSIGRSYKYPNRNNYILYLIIK